MSAPWRSELTLACALTAGRGLTLPAGLAVGVLPKVGAGRVVVGFLVDFEVVGMRVSYSGNYSVQILICVRLGLN